MGVSQQCMPSVLRNKTNSCDRITKSMGDSFKLHSQALSGYEDAVPPSSSGSDPTLSSQDMDLDMNAPFQGMQA